MEIPTFSESSAWVNPMSSLYLRTFWAKMAEMVFMGEPLNHSKPKALNNE